jgi:adenine-specific DNA-methyltransferase
VYAKDTKSSRTEKLRGETMKQLIDDNKVLWPAEPSPVFYEDRAALDHAIASGAAPKNTEATNEDPLKNICRDICAERIRRVLTGYSYQGKQGQIQVTGLGGGFAYLRCRRVPVGQLLELDHSAVWTALQLRHLEAISPYDAEASFQWAEEGDSALCYVPRFRKEDLKALRQRVDAANTVVIYSWQPGMLRQHLRRPLVTHEALPAGLSRPFGLRI